MCAKRRQDVVDGEPLGFGIGQQPRDERAQAAVAFMSWTGLRPRGADERADPSPGFEHAGASSLYTRATVFALTRRSTASCRTVGS